MKHLGEQLLGFAATVLVAVLLLGWAWQLAVPLLPVIVVGVGAWATVTYLRTRRRYF